MKMNDMKQIIERLRSRTPLFFVKLRNISLAIAAACTSAAIYYNQLPELFRIIPEEVISAVAVAGYVASFIAQLTKADPNQK